MTLQDTSRDDFLEATLEIFDRVLKDLIKRTRKKELTEDQKMDMLVNALKKVRDEQNVKIQVIDKLLDNPEKTKELFKELLDKKIKTNEQFVKKATLEIEKVITKFSPNVKDLFNDEIRTKLPQQVVEVPQNKKENNELERNQKEELLTKLKPDVMKSIKQLKEFDGWNDKYNFEEIKLAGYNLDLEQYVLHAPRKEGTQIPIILKVDLGKKELEIGADSLESRNENWYTEYKKIKSVPFEIDIENSKEEIKNEVELKSSNEENVKEKTLMIEEQTIEIER